MILIFGGIGEPCIEVAEKFSDRSFKTLDVSSLEPDSRMTDEADNLILNGWEAWAEMRLHEEEASVFQEASRWNALPSHETYLIMEDCSCGLVPLSGRERELREARGRLLQFFSGEASEVFRVIAAIPIQLKGEQHV